MHSKRNSKAHGGSESRSVMTSRGWVFLGVLGGRKWGKGEVGKGGDFDEKEKDEGAGEGGKGDGERVEGAEGGESREEAEESVEAKEKGREGEQKGRWVGHPREAHCWEQYLILPHWEQVYGAGRRQE